MSEARQNIDCRYLKIPLCLSCFIVGEKSSPLCYVERYQHEIQKSLKEKSPRVKIMTAYRNVVNRDQGFGAAMANKIFGYSYYFKKAIEISAPEYLQELEKWSVLL